MHDKAFGFTVYMYSGEHLGVFGMTYGVPSNTLCPANLFSQVDYYRICVLPLLKKFLPDNELELKVHASV